MSSAVFQRIAVLFSGLAVGVMYAQGAPLFYIIVGLVVCAYLVLIDLDRELIADSEDGEEWEDR